MLLAKPVMTISAYITLEAGAVMAFLLSMFSQVTPNPLGLDPKSSMVLAYASFITAIFGGIVAVIQVITTAKNSKVTHELDMVRKEAEHKEEMAALEKKDALRELELLKQLSEAQTKEILRNNAWIESIKKKTPGIEYGEEPDHAPEPKIVESLLTPPYKLPEATEPAGTGVAVEVESLPGAIVEQTAKVLTQASEVGKKADEVMEAASVVLKPK